MPRSPQRTRRAQPLLILVAIAALLNGPACNRSSSLPSVTRNTTLAEHSREFRRELIEVTEGVHVAVGYGLANSILIEGENGLIVVDTMESIEEAEAVKTDFRKISDKPIVAIIYTHNHADHVLGSKVFAEGRPVDVYSHETTASYLDRVASVLRPILTVRSARMFGSHLRGAALENAGIGPALGLDENSHVEALRPTQTFSDRLPLEIAGVKLELVHAPGETNDQLFVWLPEQRVLLPGDNLYRAFPNLYTIRGTPYRDVTQWVASLDAMRDLRPGFLVPSHTRPIVGEQQVESALRDYRDAIQYVHDQTIRGINQGLTPDELVEVVELPSHLARSPYLQEFYGSVRWSVRSIFGGYLGWFDGNPSRLDPLAPRERAARWAELSGGVEALVDAAAHAQQNADPQWAVELTDEILALEPDNARALTLRAQALVALGQAQSNPNARHYYLTAALELSGGLEPGVRAEPTDAMVHSIPLGVVFDALAANLDGPASLEVEKKVNFVFPDTGETHGVYLRRGVAEVQPRALESADLTVNLDSGLWKEILGGPGNRVLTLATALASGRIEVDGSTAELLYFLSFFVPDQA